MERRSIGPFVVDERLDELPTGQARAARGQPVAMSDTLPDTLPDTLAAEVVGRVVGSILWTLLASALLGTAVLMVVGVLWLAIQVVEALIGLVCTAVLIALFLGALAG